MQDTVSCSNCGKQFDVDTEKDQSNRVTCPNCGSTTRNISLSVSDAIHVTTSLDAKLTVVSSANLLMKTVIIPGASASEGRLIEAVAIPWFDIIALIRKDSSIAYQISPDKWEEIVAGAYKRSGFDEVVLTPRSGDYGRDVIAVKKGIGHVRIIDQVKAYKPGHLVTANDVRALMGVLQSDGASKGFLTTTSDFAPKIKDDPLITPFIPARLELINGKGLFKRLEELSNKK
jgi:restriction system protein